MGLPYGYDSAVRGLLVGVIWLAACYTPVIPANVLCSRSGDCPEGQTCTAGKCELAIGTLPPDGALSPDGPIIPPASDRDHDGIPDVSDNCPDVANPDQTANEDGDKFGDVCDPCPQISDNAPIDTDHDGIGDACDPNPAAHDTVWLFEGFHKGLPPWARSVNWTAVGDKLQVIASGNNTNNIPDPSEYFIPPLLPPSGTLDNFGVTATVLVTQMMGNNGDQSIGVEVYDGATTVQKGVECELDQDPAGSNSILWLVDGFNSGVNKKAAFAWTTNTEYRITMVRHGSTYTCTVVGPGGTTQTTSGTSAVLPRDSSAVDVWAFGMTAQVGSVQIIGTP